MKNWLIMYEINCKAQGWMKHYKLNTGNEGKLKEFQKFFSEFGCALERTAADLQEIDADPLQVIVHKTSQLEYHTICEDTSLYHFPKLKS